MIESGILIGTTDTIVTPQIILAEAKIEDYSASLQDPNNAARVRAEFWTKRGLDILEEKYAK